MLKQKESKSASVQKMREVIHRSKMKMELEPSSQTVRESNATELILQERAIYSH